MSCLQKFHVSPLATGAGTNLAGQARQSGQVGQAGHAGKTGQTGKAGRTVLLQFGFCLLFIHGSCASVIFFQSSHPLALIPLWWGHHK